MIYYTSDLHLGHANIIKYENRPFKTVEEMDKVIISNWNSRVNPKDTVYILGDFSFHNVEDTERILRRLHGRKHLIVGNHDLFATKQKFNKSLFASISEIKVIKDDDKNIVLCHYPMQCWYNRHNGFLHFYGHIHSNPIEYDFENSYNVGMDVQGFIPRTANEIIVKKVNPSNEIDKYPHIINATAFLANKKLVGYEISKNKKDWSDKVFQGLWWEQTLREQYLNCEYNEIVVNNDKEHDEAFDKHIEWLHRYKWNTIIPEGLQEW